MTIPADYVSPTDNLTSALCFLITHEREIKEQIEAADLSLENFLGFRQDLAYTVSSTINAAIQDQETTTND